MDYSSAWTFIIPTITAPLAGALVGLFFARFGLPGRLRWQEYYLKRIELIEKLLSFEPAILAKVQPEGIDYSLLYEELREIITKVRLMSVDMYEQSLLDFDKLPIYRRFWRLPSPQTGGGTLATVLFYLYTLGALNTVFMFLLDRKGLLTPPFSLSFFLLQLGTCLAVAGIARYAAIRSARAAAILERAKRQLLMKPVP